MIVHIKER